MGTPVRLIWQCEECDDVVVSYSHIRHDMNICDCGKSGVDLEDDYQRGHGLVKEISRKKRVDGVWKNIQ